MASSYTTNLGIEKIATGEKAGTWGISTNVNFDLIDEAVNGVVSVTLTSSHTTSGGALGLPITNGASSNGRNFFIELTDGGDIGGTGFVQLTPSDAEKVCIIKNSLSGSQNALVFQGTYDAARDLQIDNGGTVIVKFPGSGGSSTVTSILPVASSAATATTATTASGVAANSVTLGTDTTGNYVATVAGTSNQVTVTGSGSETAAVTLSLPQSIHTGADVQFDSFGVGTAASGTTGEVRATNNITAYYSSDERLKEDITYIEDALSKVGEVQGVEFNWTQQYIDEHGGEDGYFIRRRDVGLIAQEVEAVLPEVVADREDGFKAVKYDRVVALLVNAIHELTERVEELESQAGI